MYRAWRPTDLVSGPPTPAQVAHYSVGRAAADRLCALDGGFQVTCGHILARGCPQTRFSCWGLVVRSTPELAASDLKARPARLTEKNTNLLDKVSCPLQSVAQRLQRPLCTPLLLLHPANAFEELGLCVQNRVHGRMKRQPLSAALPASSCSTQVGQPLQHAAS